MPNILSLFWLSFIFVIRLPIKWLFSRSVCSPGPYAFDTMRYSKSMFIAFTRSKRFNFARALYLTLGWKSTGPTMDSRRVLFPCGGYTHALLTTINFFGFKRATILHMLLFILSFFNNMFSLCLLLKGRPPKKPAECMITS